MPAEEMQTSGARHRLSGPKAAHLRRNGLVAGARDWYYAPSGSFALSPGNPAAPWGEQRRTRVALRIPLVQLTEAA